MAVRKKVVFSLRDQIFEALKESILTNSFAPGDELQIDKIAEDFGVSTTPVREVLIRLESSGLVTLTPNKGAHVASIREQDIRDTWEMRRLLEPYAARLTAALDLGTELAELEALTERVRRYPDDLAQYQKSDTQLHGLLYSRLSNTLLQETLQRVHQMSRRMRYFAESVVPMHDQVVLEVIREHLEILKALRSHDAEAAARAVHEHIANSERRTLRAFGQKTRG